MPELAEVEFYRRKWNCGIGQKVLRVHFHRKVRVFRFSDVNEIAALKGMLLLRSEARGKLMLFQFSRQFWMAIHLGMTGHLRVEPPHYAPTKHDHLVLFQKRQALVFTDARQFGSVRVSCNRTMPEYWRALPSAVTSREFTRAAMGVFLQRHARLPIKGALLLQTGFPGIGNWMADEILWQARVHPKVRAGRLHDDAVERLWKATRSISRRALSAIVEKESEPPRNWLFHARWSTGGKCPRHKQPLKRATVAGRTTVWCPVCQRFDRA